LSKIKEHHVAVALLEAAEVVAVLLAVAEEDSRPAPKRAQLVLRVAVGDVGLVDLRPLEMRDEEDVEPVRGRHLAEVAVRLRARDLLEMEMRVGAPPAPARGIQEHVERNPKLGLSPVPLPDLDARDLRLQSAERLQDQPLP